MGIRFDFVAHACAATLTCGMLSAAHATPYAYASNSITGLTVTYVDGTSIAATTATTSISDAAQFDNYGIVGAQARGLVGTSLSINQAYSGPGPAPASNFAPQSLGTFIGARSNATIGAGSASTGGVSVSNFAEAYGPALGNSNATNNAAISFTVTGTGQALLIKFTDVYQLIASTAAALGESANASIQNNFSITDASSQTPLYSFSPSDLNQQISSVAGIPAFNSVGPVTSLQTLVSPMLTLGRSYNIALTSTASETIQPGIRIPEPFSIGLLGTGLLAVGLLRIRLKV